MDKNGQTNILVTTVCMCVNVHPKPAYVMMAWWTAEKFKYMKIFNYSKFSDKKNNNNKTSKLFSSANFLRQMK